MSGFCCTRNVWCVLDTTMHRVLPLRWHHGRLVWWICDKHDEHITRDIL